MHWEVYDGTTKVASVLIRLVVYPLVNSVESVGAKLHSIKSKCGRS